MADAHTPGPWKYDRNLGCKSIRGDKAGGLRQGRYTEIACTIGLHDESRDRANARLLAAAPDLLAVARQAAEGIRHVREIAGGWSDNQRQAFLNGIEQSARAAIAKAERG